MTNDIEARRTELQEIVKTASAALQVFPRGLFGLTPDDVKASPHYRAAKMAYNRAFAELRKFNTDYKPPKRSSRFGK